MRLPVIPIEPLGQSDPGSSINVNKTIIIGELGPFYSWEFTEHGADESCSECVAEDYCRCGNKIRYIYQPRAKEQIVELINAKCGIDAVHVHILTVNIN